jgi:predicted Fe-Mo cluster-binding NifX family protein
MRVAIPVWNNRVSPVFDTARQLLVAEIEEGREPSRTQEDLSEGLPLLRARRLAELGVNVLVCGAISRPLAILLAAVDVRVVPWTAGPVEDVLAAYIGGHLRDSRWRMPGCGEWKQDPPGGNKCRKGPRGPRRRGDHGDAQ